MLFKIMANGEVRNVLEIDQITADKMKANPSNYFGYPVDNVIAVAKDEKPVIGRKKK